MGIVTVSMSVTSRPPSGDFFLMLNRDAVFALSETTPLTFAASVVAGPIYFHDARIDFEIASAPPYVVTLQSNVVAHDGDPVIGINEFGGTVQVSWLSANGAQMQHLTPGDSLRLAGFSN